MHMYKINKSKTDDQKKIKRSSIT